jgi:hypothetical protein
MASVITSPADIVNAALAQIGHKNRVGSLYEGSRAAKDALDVYGQTRDQLLRQGDWPFAQRDIVGNLTKSAPVGGYVPPNVWDPSVNPPLPWLFEYTYEDDFIKVRAVKPQPILIPNFSPQPYLFAVANQGNQRVILSNVENAVITYVGQITDPTQMPPDFIEAFISALGRRLAPLLSNMDAAKMEAQVEQVETTLAERQQG